jgi:DNA-binding SARP family transcriptional activator/energy-coupling factor transporter ATP-binding protein EcfA2
MGTRHGRAAGGSPLGTARPAAPRVLVLGPLSVHQDGEVLQVAGTHRRRLLALLASRVGEAVSVDAIVDALWGESSPPSAAKTIQSHMTRLRRSIAGLGPDVIVTVPGGYRLDLEPVDVDAARFERDARIAHGLLAEGRLRDAGALLADVLALWRGPAYLELDGAEFALAERARLEEVRHRALEDLCEVRLSTGGAGSVVADLEGLVRAEPGRERVWALLMRALYADGRQQDALDVASRAEEALREGFGLEPGPVLRALEHQILVQDPTLAPLTASLPPALRVESPLLGRAAELAYLDAAWAAAREGRGQVCLVVGEADSGRTRLAAELAATAIEAGGSVAYLRGEDGLGSDPGSAVDDLARASRVAPQLVVVDDAEWADRTTVSAVTALTEVCTRLRVLVVVILDAGASGPAVDALTRLERAGARCLPLGAVADAELFELAVGEGVDPREASAVVALADGRPGVARREAVAWVERAASARLHQAVQSSAAAADEAGRAWGAVTEEIRSLLRARNRHDALVSAAWRGRQPYRSLATYGPEDAEIFVGRERVVAEVAARLLEHRVVLVVGPSGSGKSSLLRAGLIPLVATGQLPGEPVRSVQVRTGADDLRDPIDVDHPEPQLLVIDQFEDLFTADPETRAAGVAAIVELAGDAALDVRIVIALRADAYGRMTEVPELARLAQAAQVLVGPPSIEEIRRIVELPARRTGCEVEPKLVDLVVDDMADDPGALPLLSAALAEVWERRGDDTLGAATYLELGGLAVSVQRLGDKALGQLGPERTPAARDVLLRLVDVTDDGEWHRIHVPGDAFGPDESEVLGALSAARLVERRGDGVEITHEVVLRAWPQLAGWLDEVRLDRVADRQLKAAARSWEASSRSADDLYRGGRLELAEARAAAAPTVAPVVAAFLAASRSRADEEAEEAGARLAREVRARRRSNRLLAGVATLLVVALVAAGLAVVATRSANDARSEALAARDDERNARLVAESDASLDTDLDLALLLAAEAWRRADTPATRGALFSALAHNVSSEHEPDGSSPGRAGTIRPTPSSFAGYLSGPAGGVTDVDVSDDGRIVASTGSESDLDGSLLVVHDVANRTELLRLQLPGPAATVEISTDAATVAAVAGGTVVLVDLAGGSTTVVGPAQLGTGDVTDASIRPGHHQIALGDGTGTIRLWDWDRDEPLDTYLPSSAGRFGFLPDGRLAMAVDGPGIALWDVDDRFASAVVPLEDPPTTDWAGFSVSSVSSDGARLVGAERDGRLYLWDLRTGALAGDAANRPGTVQGVSFSPDDGVLAVSGSDGEVVLYDPVDDRPIGNQLRAHSGRVVAPAFTADGQLMVTAGDDGMIGLWESNLSGGLS